MDVNKPISRTYDEQKFARCDAFSDSKNLDVSEFSNFEKYSYVSMVERLNGGVEGLCLSCCLENESIS